MTSAKFFTALLLGLAVKIYTQSATIKNLSLLGLSVLFIIAFIIYRNLLINKKQKKIISEQKHLVDEKNKEILDSIKYARIQNALITSENYILKNLARLSKDNTKRTSS